ncbi:hypothetical protein FISHEDRAFT_73348 [Fistulina hepatica ATCC 64428]|uniref:Uncharacterized protein n=1 Tax=Fistulina hepatica ATCC 64428 TaxID=1128425 RepID=A0A0D7ACY3_9AGAR|nr:hypothetical protein FISHEDRAFT_73348 [Fistulina hepatica ATCC 64428]
MSSQCKHKHMMWDIEPDILECNVNDEPLSAASYSPTHICRVFVFKKVPRQPPATSPPPPPPPPPPQEDPATLPSDITTPKKQMNNKKYLHKWQEEFPCLLDHIVDMECDSRINNPCPCGIEKARHMVKCRDCSESPLLCPNCCVKYHKFNLWHWAKVWDDEKGCDDQ